MCQDPDRNKALTLRLLAQLSLKVPRTVCPASHPHVLPDASCRCCYLVSSLIKKENKYITYTNLETTPPNMRI